jgi:DegV family protein with EDD domain
VRIVTDSTSDVPPDVAERLGITVVPAYIQVGNTSYQEGKGLTREELYASMPEMQVTPTTSVPPAHEFTAAYRSLAEETDEIVVITLASTLSGMYSVAQLGAQEIANAKIHVVDSLQVTMGLGWMAIAAAEAAAQGSSAGDILKLLEDMKPRVRVYAMLDTLHFLRRGGRVSWARAKAVQLLRVKPILEVHMGEVGNAGQTRTRRRALDLLVDLAQAGGKPERVAVIHTLAPELDEFCQRLASLYPAKELLTAAATTIIGAHAGPSALGVALVGRK